MGDDWNTLSQIHENSRPNFPDMRVVVLSSQDLFTQVDKFPCVEGGGIRVRLHCHHDRVMQLNWLYFCGICQMMPLKVWPNTEGGYLMRKTEKTGFLWVCHIFLSSVFSNPGNCKSWPSMTNSRYQSFSARCSSRACSPCQLEKCLLMIVPVREELAHDRASWRRACSWSCQLEKSLLMIVPVGEELAHDRASWRRACSWSCQLEKCLLMITPVGEELAHDLSSWRRACLWSC